MTALGRLSMPNGLRVAAACMILLGLSRLDLDGRAAAPDAAAVPEPLTAKRLAVSLPALHAIEAGRPINSVLNVRHKMRYGESIWDEEGVPPGPRWVRVDLKAQTVSVFRAGHEIGTAVILYGAQQKPTPIGRFKILERRERHRSSLYDAPMPYTLRLTLDGVAIHGSDVRFGAATHGCIGVPEDFAKRLFAQARVGDEVMIVGETSAAAPHA